MAEQSDRAVPTDDTSQNLHSLIYDILVELDEPSGASCPQTSELLELPEDPLTYNRCLKTRRSLHAATN